MTFAFRPERNGWLPFAAPTGSAIQGSSLKNLRSPNSLGNTENQAHSAFVCTCWFGELSCAGRFRLDGHDVKTGNGHAAIIVEPDDYTAAPWVDISVLGTRHTVSIAAACHDNKWLKWPSAQMLTNTLNHRQSKLSKATDGCKPSVSPNDHRPPP